MKTMMKNITALSLLLLTPFAGANEQSTNTPSADLNNQIQVAKKVRHDSDVLPVQQLLNQAQSSQTSVSNHFDTLVEARTLHLPALTQLR